MTVPYVRVLEAPAYEPVSLDEAREWCKADTAEDWIVEMLIQAARERAEEITGRAFIRRELELRLDCFPTDSDKVIEIPSAPLISVDYVQYVDTGGEAQTMAASAYIVDTGSEPGRISPLSGQSWPAAQSRIAAVRIGYTCGYAPLGSPEDEAAHQARIPAKLKSWMHARIVTMFDNRDQFVVGQNVVAVPRDHVDGLLDGLIVDLKFA